MVAESGGLSELITPGLFFFVWKPDDPITKLHYLKYKPIMVINGDRGFDFKPETLSSDQQEANLGKSGKIVIS